MIALNIYAMCDTPKGELHHSNNIYHIWVGDGEFRDEKLIMLSGSRGNAALDYDGFAHAMGLIAGVCPGLTINVEEHPEVLIVTIHNATPEAAFHIGFQAGLFGITEVTTVSDDVTLIIRMTMEA